MGYTVKSEGKIHFKCNRCVCGTCYDSYMPLPPSCYPLFLTASQDLSTVPKGEGTANFVNHCFRT